MIKPETIQNILDATRIEEVINDFVSLQKRGRDYIACCPFHNEKTPSFHVSPTKGIYKCFGCGESGNAIGFLMKHEHYSYPEALRYLAEKYNIPIEERQLTPEEALYKTERDTLFHVSGFAQKYFADLLYNNDNGRAIGLAYFYERGLSDEIIKHFGLGYCLDEWDNFTQHAIKNGYSENSLIKTGLTIKKENDGKMYDRFRGRVMFPIFNASGHVLGFSGRVLTSEKQAAKYVNSPDSEIYNKSNIVYGIFQAKNAIGKQDLCYLVEGNIDVISMHQSGLENTVASCGTSLTKEQIRLIGRYTKNITLMYDGDSAGIKAALRAIDMLLDEGIKVHVVLFPDNDDPDSYARKYGSEQLQTFVKENAINFVAFKTKILLAEVGNDPIKKAEVANDIISSIALVADLMERTAYIQTASSILKIDEKALTQGVAKIILQNKQKEFKEKQKEKEHQQNTNSVLDTPDISEIQPTEPEQQLPHIDNSSTDEHEKNIIHILLNYGDKTIIQKSKDEEGNDIENIFYVSTIIVNDILNDNLSFDDPLCQKIFNTITENLQKGELTPIQYFINHENDDIRNFATSLLIDKYTDLSPLWSEKYRITIQDINNQESIENHVKDSLLRFKVKKITQIIKQKQEQLKNPNEDTDNITILMHEISQYQKVIALLSKDLHCVIK